MNKKRADETNIKARHNQRKQKRVREQKIRRYSFFTVLAAIFVMAVMFFTPLFNIKNIVVSGNSRVSTEQVTEQIGRITGKNLFRTTKYYIKRNVNKLSYIEKVSVKKKLFPPTVTVVIKECEPACQIEQSGEFIVIGSDGKILEKATEKQENIAVLEGAPVTLANPGSTIQFKNDNKQKIIMSCIENMKKADIIKDITVMSFADLTNITFNYQGRLDVICGTHIDFQRKLALFKEAVNSNKLTDNSRGTINLSTTGKAIYTP